MASLEFSHVTHAYGDAPGARPATAGAGGAQDGGGAPEGGGARAAGGGASRLALSDLCLSVADGESVALIGPSGCGKSTMLLMAAGLLAPTCGEVLVDGAPSDAPRRRTALILQGLGLLPWKTVRDNVELGLLLRKVPRHERRARAREALAGVGLLDQADRYPAELSGGMRQRVAIARSLALDCDLLLMDEPLSALDELLRMQVQDMLLALWLRRRHTQVLVTHSIEEAVFLGGRVVVMAPSPGRVAAVVDSPGAGSEGWRDDPLFFQTATQVRAQLNRAWQGGDAR